MSDFTQHKIALLLMAAGSSSRLGQSKQLVEISAEDNSACSLLHKQVTLMDNICLSINAQAYCVLGFESDIMIKHLANSASIQNLTIIDNANWSQGLSTSIARGVSFIARDASDVDAVLVFLVDQWQLSTDNLTLLITQWCKQPDYIHVASLDECFSPPVIFPRSFFKELIALAGDDGAKKVIKDNIKQVKSIEMPSAFVDLDTPEQLQNLNNNRH